MSAVGEIQVGCEGLGLELGEKASEDTEAKGKSDFPKLVRPSRHRSRTAVSATRVSSSEAKARTTTDQSARALAQAHCDPAARPGARVRVCTGGGGAGSLGGPGRG